MNLPQSLWWEQARSDHIILILLRRHAAEPCHQLHYLQMATEKLAKAYFWREARPPVKSHRGFVKFLRAIASRSKLDRSRIATSFGYEGIGQLDFDIARIIPVAYGLQQLAPALAGDDGPNPEYPWPTAWPTSAPATHRFTLWDELVGTNPGRNLIRLVDHAIASFPTYA